MNAGERLIVALDLPALAPALRLVDRLDGLVSFYKVGLELFTAAGPEAVTALVARGHRVFLDLKLYDVPETVKRAARATGTLGATFLTVHEAGATVAAAVEGAQTTNVGILAVTVLTSMDAGDLSSMGIAGTVNDVVLKRAARAQGAGAAGVIASPLEASAIRKQAGGELLIVTPGIRPEGDDPGDQKRLATPQAAIGAGADYLVVGRPLKNAPDPRAAAEAIIEQMQSAFDLRG